MKNCVVRLDSMLTGMNTKEVFKNVEDVSLKVGMEAKKSGVIQIVQLKNGITVNDLTSYLREFETQSGITVDAILLDYLDLMMPSTT